MTICWCLLGAHAAATGRQKVAIVADVGVDDAAGLLWALASDQLEVLGVAATFGCHWDSRVTAANARRVLEVAGRPDVPVFVGSRWPFGSAGPSPTDGTLFHGDDGFGGVGGDVAQCAAAGCGGGVAVAAASTGPSAAEFLVQVARSHPGEVTLLCFSPLTDVALAAVLEPALPRLLRDLVIMGGSVYVPGNISPLAEANFGQDAAGAQAVLQAFAEKPPVLAPLDMTMRALINTSIVEELKASGGASARLWAEASGAYFRGYCDYNGYCGRVPLHDAHTVAFLTHPSLYADLTTVPLQVLVTRPGQIEHGMSLADRRLRGDQRTSAAEPLLKSAPAPEAPVRVLLDVDDEGFVRAFLEQLARLP